MIEGHYCLGMHDLVSSLVTQLVKDKTIFLLLIIAQGLR